MQTCSGRSADNIEIVLDEHRHTEQSREGGPIGAHLPQLRTQDTLPCKRMANFDNITEHAWRCSDGDMAEFGSSPCYCALQSSHTVMLLLDCHIADLCIPCAGLVKHGRVHDSN